MKGGGEKGDGCPRSFFNLIACNIKVEPLTAFDLPKLLSPSRRSITAIHPGDYLRSTFGTLSGRVWRYSIIANRQ